MHWAFSFGWFLGGIAIALGGTLTVLFYKQVADMFGLGVGSYNKVKLYGVIACLIGLIVMTNLHTVILYGVFHLLMPSIFK